MNPIPTPFPPADLPDAPVALDAVQVTLDALPTGAEHTRLPMSRAFDQ